MGTLTGCMSKAGKLLHSKDREAILQHAAEFRAGGMDTQAAAVAAVDKRIAHVNAQPERKGGGSASVLMKAAREFAENLVASRKVRDLKPGKHTAAETRAGKAAEKAMMEGDTQGAILAKRDQLLQLEAAKATIAAKAEMEKKVKAMRKLEANETLPLEYKDQIEKLLERVELKEKTQREMDKRATLADWVKAQEEMGLDPIIPAYLLEGSNLTNYKDMTVEELRGLYDTLKQIEHLGRLKNKLLAAKDARDFNEVRDRLAENITLHAGDRVATIRTATTPMEEKAESVREFFAAHLRVANLARELDGNKDGGVVWESFIRGANEKSAWETTMRAEATKRLTDIMAPWLAKGELSKKTHFPSIGRSLTRQEVFAMALNTGNESNLQRLIGGENWTQAQLDPVLNSMEHWEWKAVQEVWDYFGELFPLTQDKHERVYGKRLEGIPHGSTVTDRLGLRGGYYPVKYDPRASVRAEEHDDAEGAARLIKGAYGAATTRRSFTKARVEEVKDRPLLYNLSGLYNGVNDVLHDLAWHEWLIDTNRLLKSTPVDSAIRTHYGAEYVRQIKSWRDAIAEGDSKSQQALDGFLGVVRQSVSIAGLGFNVMSAALQPLGLTNSISRVGAEWVGKGVSYYIASPAEATTTVQGKSEFMRNRARTQFRDLNELRNRVRGEDGAMTAIKGNAYFLMMQAQRAVDVPTWYGAYLKALSEKNSDERAVDLADQAVIDAQGGGEMKDQSAMERGEKAHKLFTVFYSFMGTVYGLLHTSARTDNPGKLAANVLLLAVVPAVLTSLLKNALTPGDSGDDKDWKTLAKKLAKEQLAFLMGLMVGVREFSELAAIFTDNPSYGYDGPAGLRLVGDTMKLGQQMKQGDFDDSFRKAAINVLGDTTGLPSAQINKVITGAKAMKEGKTQNPAALVFGYQEPH